MTEDPNGGHHCRAVRAVGLVGTGSVGSGWAAAYLARGYQVFAYDPEPGAPRRLDAFLHQAWPSLRALSLTDLAAPPTDRLSFGPLAEVARASDWLHENAPERVEVKRDLIREIELHAGTDVVICSSSGGLMPSDIQEGMADPGRLVVAHPFNPSHLVPLVEVVAGRHTRPDVVERTVALMVGIGKRPIRIKREATAYMANRLQFALLREAVHCLVEGIASPQAIDDAVRFALAPRWAVMGGLMTFALAGGAGGMASVVDKFGASTEAWWASLGAPTMTPQVREALVSAADELAAGRSMAEWIGLRDRELVRMLHLVQERDE